MLFLANIPHQFFNNWKSKKIY